jgi:hypothetical protein
MQLHKCATKTQFTECAADAQRNKRNRQVTPELLDAMDPHGINLVWFAMNHNDVEMRTCWMIKLTGQDLPAQIQLDMAYETYAGLPDLAVNESGTLWSMGFGLTEQTA